MDEITNLERLVDKAAQVVLVADRLANDLELFAGDNPGQQREWLAQAERLRELATEKVEFIQRLCLDTRQRITDESARATTATAPADRRR